MIDLVIGHCELRIRRTAGSAAPWLDEEDHRRLADRVQRVVLPMLEGMLAPRLAASPPSAVSSMELGVEFDARELLGAAPLARPSLHRRLGEAIEQALARAERPAPDRRANPESPAPREESLDLAAPQPEGEGRFADPVALLHRLLTGSQAALEVLPMGALCRLLRSVYDVVAGRAGGRGSSALGADGLAEIPTHGFQGDGPTRAEIIAVLEQLGKRSPAEPQDRQVDAASRAAAGPGPLDLARALLDRIEASREVSPDARLAPSSPEVPGRPRREPERPVSVSDGGVGAAPAPQVPSSVAARSAWALACGRYPLDHLLPLLAVAVLARHRLFDALSLDAPIPEDASVIGAAIALKTLAPDSAKGPGAWPQAARVASARAAGRERVLEGAALASTAAHLVEGTALVRAGVAALLVDSLQPGRSVPLVGALGDAALFDPGGLYPIATGSVHGLVPLMGRLDRTLFVHPPDAEVWSAIAEARLPALAEGPPLPGERAEEWVGTRGWRGHATPEAARTAGLRRRMETDAASANRAHRIWQALGSDARLLPAPARDRQTHELDTLAGLLAGFALADMGWSLFRLHPRDWIDPDPLLVRDRFGDLSGWLEVSRSRIEVVLPMGRRFIDLRDAGLLDSVSSIPWWPERELVFRGG